MDAQKLLDIIDADFYTGVPDSQLRALCDCLMDTYGIDAKHHVIGANEGNCAAMAAGYHMATGKSAVVYMQNSGQGNVVNPITSLLDERVYAIPVIYIIGWRGEPGVHDEPQHVYQGEITIKLLELLGISSCVIDKETTEDMVAIQMQQFRKMLKLGKSVAFVIRKEALSYEKKVDYHNENTMSREAVIEQIVQASGDDLIVSTTGKTSRELYEIREVNARGHQYDFLTVGSMGHSSSIALTLAVQHPEKRVWCIDGDGALLMHMGAVATIGSIAPKNLVHIIINNSSHETVGGMPTVAQSVDITAVAKACGYRYVVSINNLAMLKTELQKAKCGEELCLLEIKTNISSRKNLGRPLTAPVENKIQFMEYIKSGY